MDPATTQPCSALHPPGKGVPWGHSPPHPPHSLLLLPTTASPPSLQESQGTARACVPVKAHLAQFSPIFAPLSP